MMLGQMRGGAVRFGALTSPLIIAEGIETALSLHTATGKTVWAALSSSNMKSLILPPLSQMPEVIIAADHDDAGIYAANAAAEIWSAEGRGVSIAMPPQGQDFNDVLRGV